MKKIISIIFALLFTVSIYAKDSVKLPWGLHFGDSQKKVERIINGKFTKFIDDADEFKKIISKLETNVLTYASYKVAKIEFYYFDDKLYLVHLIFDFNERVDNDKLKSAIEEKYDLTGVTFMNGRVNSDYVIFINDAIEKEYEEYKISHAEELKKQKEQAMYDDL